MNSISRRQFLGGGLATAGGLAVSGPLGALSLNGGPRPRRSPGYGPLVEGEYLALPKGFKHKKITEQFAPMSDGNPTPGVFDGTGSFAGPHGTTILILNHENRENAANTPVVVPADKRYDAVPVPGFNAGNTKLVIGSDRRLIQHFAVLGGTSTNCAGGVTPWGSWITCEEVFKSGSQPHGLAFEIPSAATGPIDPVPITQAGRFVREAVCWASGSLYQTEDQSQSSTNPNSGATLTRYTPDRKPRRAGDLAASTGVLEALAISGQPTANVTRNWPVGIPFHVEWVTIDVPAPSSDTMRVEAFSKGAARFNRLEGCWTGEGGKIYFDSTNGGAAGLGQIWELDTRRDLLTLIYESTSNLQLKSPDNIVVVPTTGDILLCEDSSINPQYIRGLTTDGEIYDFARAIHPDHQTEFAGACFDPTGQTLFVSQQGEADGNDEKGILYAIWGPWRGRAGLGGLIGDLLN